MSFCGPQIYCINRRDGGEASMGGSLALVMPEKEQGAASSSLAFLPMAIADNSILQKGSDRRCGSSAVSSNNLVRKQTPPLLLSQ
jgi:hypothetical protein